MTLKVFIVRENLNLYKLSGYSLRWWEQTQADRIRQGKDKIHSWLRMKKMLAINFYPLDCDKVLLYTKQDYCWPRNLYLNYFEEPNILSLKEKLHVEENIVLEEYVEVKEENIKIFEEINEGLVIEEEPEIKIVEEIKEDHIIEKDLEVKMAETI